jgi:hypothetical protein
MKNKTLVILAIILVFSLLLSACNAGDATPEIPTGEATSPSVTEAAVATEAATEGASSIAACPVGTWKVTDLMPYMVSLEQNLTAQTGGDFTFSNTSYSGDAEFVFNADQTASFSGADFTESMTMSANVNGASMDIPMTIKINGISTAKYSTDGDKLSISDQDNGSINISIDVMGNSSGIDQGLLGKPGTIQLYQFACPDANTLTLKVIAVENMDLAPLTLTRMP